MTTKAKLKIIVGIATGIEGVAIAVENWLRCLPINENEKVAANATIGLFTILSVFALGIIELIIIAKLPDNEKVNP